jgi:cell wall assembly regulator SMI1
MKTYKNKVGQTIVYKLNFDTNHGLCNNQNDYIGYYYQSKKKGFWLL